MTNIKWLFREYLTSNHIENLKTLAKMSGIKYQTLLARMNNPRNFKVFEIDALDNVLHFSPEDLASLVKGGKQ